MQARRRRLILNLIPDLSTADLANLLIWNVNAKIRDSHKSLPITIGDCLRNVAGNFLSVKQKLKGFILITIVFCIIL